MRKYERIKILQDATMRLVAENSLVGLSMRQVSDFSGINQSMIYRDFGNKENLLLTCYESAKSELKSVFQKIHTQDIRSTASSEGAIRKKWDMLIDALIDNDHRTIYLCEYRERHMKNTGLLDSVTDYPEGGTVHENSCFEYQENHGCYRDVVEHFVETAIIYSKKVLYEELIDDIQNREKVWNLLRGVLKVID